MEMITKIIILGIFSTVIIDFWAAFSSRIFHLPKTNWSMVGRWVGHIPNGRYFHDPIGSSHEIRGEYFFGWLFHYFIGVAYAGIYVALVVLFFQGSATLLFSWLFGLLTILSPWLILQPALGLGICAVKAIKPNLVRLQNLCIHSIFGIALYFGWKYITA
jgi:hypothetical protein